MIAWLILNWRVVAVGAALAAMLGSMLVIDQRGYARGYAAAQADQARVERGKADAANRADEDSRRCAADPECRLRNDGFRRD